MKPAIGFIEFNSIAAGIFATDAMAKKSDVDILDSRSVCPGKYVVLVGGLTGPVDEAMQAGLEAGADAVTDHLFLPNVHPAVVPAILAAVPVDELDALGVIETFSIPSCILAADSAVKEAEIELIEIRLANGLGGKSFVTFTGEIHDVEAALKKGAGKAGEIGCLVRTSLVPRPHPVMKNFVL
ncbi:MAG TPA: BMC domain-containing protein [bacterium]|nr:BMC domain-containing protein [bacterium]HPQ66263.1 BMC domain-containing protein [bacterium]